MFYPRVSPNFLVCRRAVRPLLDESIQRTSPGLVVGLSGGADSLALTASIAAEARNLTEQQCERLEAVVIDHGLQKSSHEVALRAAEQARDMGLRSRVIRVHVPSGGDGLEAEARRARYSALQDAADGRLIAVAHTLDDQAETYILGALRGAPTGMRAAAGLLRRPFLGVRRDHTEGACAELSLDYWQDPHNHDRAYRRVAVRLDVVPSLSDLLGGDASGPLAQAATKAAEDNALLEELAGPPTAECRDLAEQPGPLRRRRIASFLRLHGLAINEEIIRGVEKLVVAYRGQGGVAAGWSEGRRLEVRRVGGKLAIVPQ